MAKRVKKSKTTENIQKETVEILRALEIIADKFDKREKDYHAADKLLHDRHEKRLEKLERN